MRLKRSEDIEILTHGWSNGADATTIIVITSIWTVKVPSELLQTMQESSFGTTMNVPLLQQESS